MREGSSRKPVGPADDKTREIKGIVASRTRKAILHNIGLMRTRILCWSLVACAWWNSTWAQEAASAPVARLVLNSALTAESDEPRFPSQALARTVSLPDVWPEARPDSRGPVWYRMNLNLAYPVPTGLGVWFARACGHLDVKINGQALVVNSPSKTADAPLCNQGRLIPLPPALLLDGLNLLDVKLSGRPLANVISAERAAGLSEVIIDRLDRLQVLSDGQQTSISGTAQAATLAMVFLGGFLIVQGWQNRRESHLAYFGLLLIAVGLTLAPRWLPTWAAEGLALELVLASLWSLATWAAVQFLLRHAEHQRTWANWLLPLQAVAVPVTLAMAGPEHLNLGMRIWVGIFALQLLAAVAVHLLFLRSTSSSGFWTMVAVVVLLIVGQVSVQLGLHIEWPVVHAALHLVAPVVLGLLGLRLVQQRRRALESAEVSRMLLEQRVAEVKADIEANYRQLSDLRVTQVTDRERKRIAADLHDDLGAKLLTIVHTSESERISTLAREALEEMRLSVRGLTGKPVRLEDALGDWRAEVISRLGQAGIEAVWNMPTDSLPHTLPARNFVQTTRIVREAVNNIIKHSGASQCAVRCQVAEGDFQLVIQDNGKGIAEVVDGRLDRGHGLSSMKGRAKQLQGQCLVESGPGYGTVIRLTVPLEKGAQPA
jgi:two-component system, NarL family, sensor histidine kinase UhpB